MRILKGVHGDPGTILGPTTMGEYMVILEDTEEGTKLGFATQPHMYEALGRIATGDIRSLTEINMARSVGIAK